MTRSRPHRIEEACRHLGIEDRAYPDEAVCVSDDFGWYIDGRPGAMFLMGCGAPTTVIPTYTTRGLTSGSTFCSPDPHRGRACAAGQRSPAATADEAGWISVVGPSLAGLHARHLVVLTG